MQRSVDGGTRVDGHGTDALRSASRSRADRAATSPEGEHGIGDPHVAAADELGAGGLPTMFGADKAAAATASTATAPARRARCGDVVREAVGSGSSSKSKVSRVVT
jgi:hypothetical protein